MKHALISSNSFEIHSLVDSERDEKKSFQNDERVL